MVAFGRLTRLPYVFPHTENNVAVTREPCAVRLSAHDEAT